MHLHAHRYQHTRTQSTSNITNRNRTLSRLSSVVGTSFGSQEEVPELQIFTGIIKLFPRLSIFLLIVFKLFLFHYGYKLIELNTHTHTQYTSYKEFRNGMSTQDWRTIPIIYAINFRLKILISNHREVSILASLYQQLHRVCTV